MRPGSSSWKRASSVGSSRSSRRSAQSVVSIFVMSHSESDEELSLDEHVRAVITRMHADEDDCAQSLLRRSFVDEHVQCAAGRVVLHRGWGGTHLETSRPASTAGPRRIMGYATSHFVSFHT